MCAAARTMSVRNTHPPILQHHTENFWWRVANDLAQGSLPRLAPVALLVMQTDFNHCVSFRRSRLPARQTRLRSQLLRPSPFLFNVSVRHYLSSRFVQRDLQPLSFNARDSCRGETRVVRSAPFNFAAAGEPEQVAPRCFTANGSRIAHPLSFAMVIGRIMKRSSILLPLGLQRNWPIL